MTEPDRDAKPEPGLRPESPPACIPAGDAPPAARPARYFIAGCQRSGTTLMRLVLECHPEVFCYDEIEGYKALVTDRFTPPPGKRLIGFKVPRWTEQFEDEMLADEGLEETASQLYRREPIVFMLRDVRDTVASMRKLMAGEAEWLHVYGRSILESKIRQPRFCERFGREIAQLRSGGESLAAVGAFYWKYKTQAYFDYLARAWPVCGVPYEALVRDPEPHLRRVLAFLGLAWCPNLLDHPQSAHAELYPNGTTVGNTDPRRPIHADSVGQWRQILSAAEVSEILALAGDLNDRLAGLAESPSPSVTGAA
jgi:hypothetical protein